MTAVPRLSRILAPATGLPSLLSVTVPLIVPVVSTVKATVALLLFPELSEALTTRVWLPSLSPRISWPVHETAAGEALSKANVHALSLSPTPVSVTPKRS